MGRQQPEHSLLAPRQQVSVPKVEYLRAANAKLNSCALRHIARMNHVHVEKDVQCMSTLYAYTPAPLSLLNVVRLHVSVTVCLLLQPEPR